MFEELDEFGDAGGVLDVVGGGEVDTGGVDADDAASDVEERAAAVAVTDVDVVVDDFEFGGVIRLPFADDKFADFAAGDGGVEEFDEVAAGVGDDAAFGGEDEVDEFGFAGALAGSGLAAGVGGRGETDGIGAAAFLDGCFGEGEGCRRKGR